MSQATHSSSLLEPPDEVLSTMNKDGRRRWLYPVLSDGLYQKRRTFVAWGLILLYIALPIVPINGNPALLLDVVHRKFHIFGATLRPTDTLLMMFTLMSIFLGIVMITALLGRAWCGWACPQTVYMEFVFRPIERLFEGKESVRKRADEAELTMDRFWRKAGKFSVWTLVALGLAHVFVSYFVGWSSLIHWMTGSPREHWGFFVMMGLTTALILADFAWFREQMCTLTCPYARIQSVLLDRDSLIVSYDAQRGEPRTKPGRKASGADPIALVDGEAGVASKIGDCVDCGACVRTCPTGIDIRNGLQMECIGCTQCIDACDAIMDKVGKPRGLVRYTSENVLEKKPARVLRPRVVMYSLGLAILATLFTITILSRQSIEASVVRVPGPLFSVLPDGDIANRLRFRVENHTGEDGAFHIEALAPQGAQVRVIGATEIQVKAGEMVHQDAWVVAPKGAFQGLGTAEGSFRVVAVPKAGAQEVEPGRPLPFKLMGPSK